MFLLIRFWRGSFSFSERGEIRAEASGMSGYYYYYDFSPRLVLFLFDIDGLGIFVRCDVM